jgi:tetratricopeptide (TPR) repeat protein
MTFVSKLALAAVLTLGASGIAASPALAQKKDQKAEPQLKVSEEFRKPAGAADAALKANDFVTAEPQIAAAEAAAKSDQERYFASWLRLRLERNRKNAPATMAAAEAIVNNPATPPEEVKSLAPTVYYYRGSQLADQKKWNEAIPMLLKARQAGSAEGDLSVLLANGYAAQGKQEEAIAEVNRAITASKAAGRKPPEEWYRFVIPRVNQAGNRATMAEWLTRYIQEYPSAKNWRWAIQVFRQGTTGVNEKVEKLDLYRLMRATNSLADRGDYADYAYLAQQAGLPWEAVAVVDEGRKAGKIPQGDADVQRTYAAAQAGAKAEGSLEGLAKQATTATAAVQTANAFLASGNNARALELYDAALQKGATNADEVHLHRGIALQRLGRKEEARAAFQQVKGGYANLATLWQASIDLPPLAA